LAHIILKFDVVGSGNSEIKTLECYSSRKVFARIDTDKQTPPKQYLLPQHSSLVGRHEVLVLRRCFGTSRSRLGLVKIWQGLALVSVSGLNVSFTSSLLTKTVHY